MIERLAQGFLSQLRDRDGAPPPAAGPVRLVEKTPKNALRVPFLAAAFPDARFVYLYRDPRETISSMLDAWRSGAFVTYPALPGWSGPPWSLLLVPGWRDLIGQELGAIVARQWATTTTTLLDDLAALAPDRWCVTSYDRLLAEPRAEIERICEFADLAWDDDLDEPLPLSRHTLDSPRPEKWRRNAAELASLWSEVDQAATRAHEVFAHPPRTRPTHPPATTDVVAPEASEPDDRDGGFSSVHTSDLPALLDRLAATLLVSTYQSGRLIAVRVDGDRLNTHFRRFHSPMGIAADRRRLALGTKRAVWEYRNQPAVARKLHPEGRHDACFLPRASHVTGDIQIHEIAYVGDELWAVATRFSCLATLDDTHSFVPRWRPPFVTALAAEDRCHLNGMAIVDDEVRYVTAMGRTDTPGGWRDDKASGGVVLHVPSGEVVASGLSMPHSPRVHDGKLWVLSSGRGEVCTVDVESGAVEVVAKVPGFTRGLAFAGHYAFVGLSQVRESIFGGVPLTEEFTAGERRCGVWVLDTRSGAIVGFLRFEGAVQEIFDVQVLAGVRWPELAEPDAELTGTSFVLPDEAMTDVHVARP